MNKSPFIHAAVDQIKVGDKISPPKRELSLWMREMAEDKGIPYTELLITTTKVYEAAPDKRGRWIAIEGYLPDAWYSSNPNGKRYVFSFKSRPETLWQIAK